jgi:hypothetical protein
MVGQSSFQTTANAAASGAPFTAASADNGLSVSALGRIVLGQDVGAAGNPANVTTSREIPFDNGTNLTILDATGKVLAYIDPGSEVASFGYDLAGTEADRMAVFGPAAGAGEGVEMKGAQRINIFSPQVFITDPPAASLAGTEVLVRNNGVGAGRIEKISGVSGTFTTVDLKTVTVTDGIITSIV